MKSKHQASKAVALSYDGKRAPFVSASASSELAEEILAIAREHEIPIYENQQLVETLAMLEIGEEIPEILYLTIAEIIAFVYMLKGKKPDNANSEKAASEAESTNENHTQKLLPGPKNQ